MVLSDSKIQYVNGFAFSHDEQKVVLIVKNRPRIFKGLKNGVGGKIEEGETALDAIQREFFEETGVQVYNWELFLIQEGEYYKMFCFRTTMDVSQVYTKTDEEVVVNDINKLEGVIPNLEWMIPMALDKEVQLAQVSIKDEKF